MAVAASPRVTVGGKTLSKRVWGLLEDAKKAASITPGSARVMQGSFNKGVSASAGTHDGGGAADLSLAGLTHTQQLALIQELRRRNACAWLRTKQYGWNGDPHCHLIVRDEPGLTASARKQVTHYDAGNNALAGASRQKDTLPRPKQYSVEEVRRMATAPKPYVMLKRQKDQTIKLNTWTKLDIDDGKDSVLPAVGADDFDVYVNLNLSSVTGAKRNDLRYIVGRWARHDSSSDDLTEMGGVKVDVTGADTKAIPPDLPKSSWRSTWTHGFKGQAGVPVSFWVYVGSTVDGTVVSPLRIFKVDDEA